MLLSYKCFSVWAGKLRLEKLRPKKLGFTARSVCQIFTSRLISRLIFYPRLGLIHPILVYHNFRGKSNFGRSGMFCRILILTGKIWQGALAQNLPISPLWICLLEIGGSLVPNQSPLQTESQSKTRTPDLWFSRATWIFYLKKNLFVTFKIWHLQKFDSAAVSSSQHRTRRRDSIGKDKFGKPAILSL